MLIGMVLNTYQKGYRRILSVYHMSRGQNTKERRRAHSEFSKKHGLSETTFPYFEDNTSVYGGNNIAEWWVQQEDRPDAIF